MGKEIKEKNKEKKIIRFIIIVMMVITFLVTLTSCQKVKAMILENKTQNIKTQSDQKIIPLFAKITQGTTPQIEKFKSNDKILVLAPHPDDEAIGAAGVIQRALKAGAEVNVVCLTSGDSEQIPVIVYKKSLPNIYNLFLLLGKMRRKESIDAMSKLGLKENDIKFLGYPDSGILNILLEHWSGTEPYRNPLTQVSEVPYPECYSPGAYYEGENILKDLTSIIKKFEPTKIFVSSPIDLHSDHRALYLFLRVALWDLEGKIKDPEVFTYLVHARNWPDHRGYHPENFINPPKQIIGNEITWSSLSLDNDEIKKKYESIQSYKSQVRNFPLFLVSFDGGNELFASFDNINLENKNQSQIVWQTSNPDGLSYALNNGNLFVKMKFKQKLDKDFSISIYLLGYNNKIIFGKMPKIHIKIGIVGLKVFDKSKEIITSKINLSNNGGSFIISIPLGLLGNPKYILNGVETKKIDLLNSSLGWRILSIN